MAKWHENIEQNLSKFEKNLNYLKFPSSDNNKMTNIIYDRTTTATNSSDLGNSSHLFGLENNIYETPYDFEQILIDFGPKRDSLHVVIPLTIIYGLIFITGVIGNISTCIVIKKNRSMHTATNYYLFSLAISDFLLLLSGVPQEIYLTWSKYPYVFGEYFCVGRGILAETSANATVLTITAFTVERYVAICHPFLGQAISKLSRAIRIIILIWLLSILTAIPQALQFGLISHQGVELCVVVRIILNHSFQLSTYIFFFAPMSIIFVLYLLIGLHLYRSNVISGGSGGVHESLNSKGLQHFRGDISSGLSGQNAHIRRGRFGIKSTQSDTILYRYSGGTQVSGVRGRMNQFGTKRVLKMLDFFGAYKSFHKKSFISKLSRAIRIIILIWLLSILTAIPQALQFGLISHQGVELCVVGLQHFRGDISSGLSGQNAHIRRGRFGIKSTQSDTILYRYSGGTQVSGVRGRMNQFGTKRVLKMLVAVVICFFLCWAPFHAQRLIAVYGSTVIIPGYEETNGVGESDDGGIDIINEQIFATTSTIQIADGGDLYQNNVENNERDHHIRVYTVMTYISGILYYLSTCINPLLYNLMSNKFRQAFKSILLGKNSSNVRRSQNSLRSMSRKPTTNSSSINRGSSESELQSKASLLQTISHAGKMNPKMIP